jgi:hypothetical protein
MKAIRSGYFDPNPLKKDIRTSLVILGVLLAAAGGVLVLQSFVYASSIPDLWVTGQNIWWPELSLMLQILAIWAVVLGIIFAVRDVTQPVTKYGSDFWEGIVTGVAMGLVLPFLLVLGAGLAIFIPLGLLSLLVTEVYPFATLQFAWLAAGYLVFLWIVVGLVPLLAGVFLLKRWYYKFIAVLLLLQLSLDVLQTLEGVLKILLTYGIWQTNDIALLAALFGSLLVSSGVVLWSLRGYPAITIGYAILGVYMASIVTGNFSERLFAWGEVPSAVLACLAPVVYLQAAKWILRRDGTAAVGLAAGYAGLLAGLLVIHLLQLQLSGQGWLSLLYGVIALLGLGLILGMLLGRRITKLLAGRLQLPPPLLRYMDTGVVAGIMAGMFIGGFLAR